MGDYLFDPKNAAALESYKKFTLGGTNPLALTLGRCADPTIPYDPDTAALESIAYTVPAGSASNLFWNSAYDMVSVQYKGVLQCIYIYIYSTLPLRHFFNSLEKTS